ncbi:MAG TPA: wax ester/triacylglycerol synthase domain-containing protein [Microthrixaceae bacterium]|nr:wax ester/triacylglycerol synthase domain-containing protein [Microthrixaceae bacterium]
MSSSAMKDSGPSRHFDDRMSDSDALMWNIEKDPMLRSTITTVMVFEGPVPSEKLARTFERASRTIPRLRQRVRSNPMSLAPPRWEIDPNFDIHYHLRSARVRGEGSLSDLLEMVSPMAMQSFDRARPLWEATVVDGLVGDMSAIVMKFHHSISDGVGGVELMLELLDLEEDAPERPMPPAPVVHVLNQAERFVDALQFETKRQAAMLKQATSAGVDVIRGAAYDPAGAMIASSELASSVARLLRPESTPMSGIATHRSLSTHLEVLTMPLDEAKAAGAAMGGTINDIFVAGIIRGMDLYHQSHGVDQEHLRMGMPVNVRGAASMNSGGNEWVPARFEVDVHHGSSGELVAHVHQRCAAAKDEPANSLVRPMSTLLNRLPTTVLTQVFGTMMKGLDFQASNVPGSPVRLYMGGVPITAVYPFGPLAGAGVNVTLLSYQNDLNIGVNIDPVAIPDVESLMESLRDAYDELLDIT